VLAIKEKEDLSFSETSKRLGIGRDTLFRWSKNIEAKIKRDKPATKINREALKKDVEDFPDAYQYERAGSE
jgi:hypothetical protein